MLSNFFSMRSVNAIVPICLYLVYGCGIRYTKLFTLPSECSEVSGIYRYAPDTIFLHNDGGNPAELFEFDKQGQLRKTHLISNAENLDWEDLAYDGKGRIFIADIGDNYRKRDSLGIYIWNMYSRSLEGRIYVKYPLGERYNAEALYWNEGLLYLIVKNQAGSAERYSRIFTLPDRAGTHVAVLSDSLLTGKYLITAADFDPQSQRSVFIAYKQKNIFGMPHLKTYAMVRLQGGSLHKYRLPPLGICKQVEAVSIVDNGFFIASEKTPISRPFIAYIRLEKTNRN